MINRIRSSIPGIVWPVIPEPFPATLLALLQQLERSQWWPEETLRVWQFRQLEKLLIHAWHTIPFYRERLGSEWKPVLSLTPERFSRMPVLSRADIQALGMSLCNIDSADKHGGYRTGRTSGSTGRPLTCHLSKMSDLIWGAIILRSYQWHHIDLSMKAAYIQARVTESMSQTWRPPVNWIWHSGPSFAQKVSEPVENQLAWLQEIKPDYLFTYPSNLDALAKLAIAQGIKLDLKCMRTRGETLTDQIRINSRKAFGAEIFDIYGANETGTIAQECGDAPGRYHIQSETAYVEVLNNDGMPCAPGEIGRVVITPLHNFVMPLVRYAIGDFAEMGEPCSCGRGLPVLKRILGRTRNLVQMPDGRRFWPMIGENEWTQAHGIHQYQVIQKNLTRLEVRVVADHALTADEKKQIAEAIHENFGYPFEVFFIEVAEIARSTGGKFEDFICELVKD